MRKEIVKKIEIPKGVKIDIDNMKVIIEGGRGKISRMFKGRFIIEKGDNIIELKVKRATKKDKRLLNSAFSHIKNMIHGVSEGYTYKLKVCFVHFPISLSVEGKNLIVKNFLGEVKSRRAEILQGVEMKIDKDLVIITSADKERAGQT
ncbi:MAG: 50S ribosomal protein L6, partial [Nanoarchaeota archaeon]